MCSAVQCFAKEQIAATAAVERWRWLRKRAQAATALEASRLRKARAARVEKLKVTSGRVCAEVQAAQSGSVVGVRLQYWMSTSELLYALSVTCRLESLGLGGA